MSASLVRKGLDLFSDDFVSTSSEHPSTKGKKKLKSKKKQISQQERKMKFALDEYLKHRSPDYTEENLKYIKRISKKKIKSAKINKIMEHHNQNNLKQDDQRSEEKKQQQQTTAFDEEDFRKFSVEYMTS